MAKIFDCLTGKQCKYVLLKDYGDSPKYTVLSISMVDIIVKTDKRIKSVEDFVKLYGYGCEHTKEDMVKALICNFKNS